MNRYNLSNIMRRAWELVRKSAMTISSGLKKAWDEAKNPEKIVTMNVCRKETFTINTKTGIISGNTYHAKEWIKKNFDAKWDAANKCWIASPERIKKELKYENYYKLYIVEEAVKSDDEIVNKRLVNRNDGFYCECTHKSGKVSYAFVG